MINCQITRDGKIEEEVRQDGLTFVDNHGMERSNHLDSVALEASLKEWHYQKFGIMNQHFRGKENGSALTVEHEVRPAMMLSLATRGEGMKNVYEGRSFYREVSWKAGEANLCFLDGVGGVNVNLNQDTQLDMLSIVIPQQFIDQVIARNPEVLDQLSPLSQTNNNAHIIYRDKRPVEEAVIKAARDIQRSRMMGNHAHKYLEAKIIDCLSGFLLPESLMPGKDGFNLSIRDKMHDAKAIILSHYQDMPSLHDLATMVGTNECTLKKAFKQEFGTTVFQYLFDYRMRLATQYLLDTALPIADIGILLGYDYQSHFCTAFKRKFGVSPMEFRLRRGVI